jgi:RimJ/RimL family protein N-acetyltransferase/uncharacterized protein YndB with AHSA1/START domain
VTSTRINIRVNAPRAVVYQALIDPHAVATWRVPNGMTSQVHEFDAREGGAFRISLTYDAPTGTGKTTAHTDTYHGRFVKLVKNEQVVEVVEFETTDPAMRGEMTISISLADADGGTEISAVHDGLPSGVSAADNEVGWRMSLGKLAALVEAPRRVVIETDRLLLRYFEAGDAGVVLRILNEPSFIENVGDKGVRTTEDAAAYLASGPIASYEAHGYGLYLVVLKNTNEPIGMCGLLNRPQFADVDVGYSFLPEFWRRGFAAESVSAVIEHARRALGIGRIIALVAPHNVSSARLLEKLGFTFRERALLQPAGSEVLVYASAAPEPGAEAEEAPGV